MHGLRSLSRPSSRRALVALAVVALAAALVATTAAPAPTPDRKQRLQQALDRLVAAGAPGALALVRDGNLTIRLASGSAILKPRTRLRPTDRFRGGSVTKSFTATLVLRLVGEGKVALADSVEHWLPGLVPNGGAITVRRAGVDGPAAIGQHRPHPTHGAQEAVAGIDTARSCSRRAGAASYRAGWDERAAQGRPRGVVRHRERRRPRTGDPPRLRPSGERAPPERPGARRRSGRRSAGRDRLLRARTVRPRRPRRALDDE